ncbi:MAG: cytochrome c family protein [Candidatus Bipolaricaulia bacterium]
MLAKRTKRSIVAALGGLLLLGTVLFLMSATAEEATYVGSETCMTCHQDKYDDFKASGHPYKLRLAEAARTAGIPKPDYVSWDDILFVIGGFGWKARYIGQDGYIITQSKDGKIKGQNQFNLETEQFVDYHAGEKKAYNCGKCHTTGYGEPGGFESMEKTPGLANVQCEACHGAGSGYRSPKIMSVKAYKADREAAHKAVLEAGLIIPDEKTCTKCHNEESPFYKPFNFAEYKEKIKHWK